jgi:hypothetical protein
MAAPSCNIFFMHPSRKSGKHILVSLAEFDSVSIFDVLMKPHLMKQQMISKSASNENKSRCQHADA